VSSSSSPARPGRPWRPAPPPALRRGGHGPLLRPADLGTNGFPVLLVQPVPRAGNPLAVLAFDGMTSLTGRVLPLDLAV